MCSNLSHNHSNSNSNNNNKILPPLNNNAFQGLIGAALCSLRRTPGAEVLAQIEKAVLLQVLDSLWREHLASMDYLRKGIHLRGYAQKDPKNEYKREAFDMFSDMLTRLKHETVTVLARGRVRADITDEAREERRKQMESLDFQHAEAATAADQAVAAAATQSGEDAPAPVDADEAARANLPGSDAPARSDEDNVRPETFVRDERKIGRNEVCPCGSGKKFKHCHGRDQQG